MKFALFVACAALVEAQCHLYDPRYCTAAYNCTLFSFPATCTNAHPINCDTSSKTCGANCTAGSYITNPKTCSTCAFSFTCAGKSMTDCVANPECSWSNAFTFCLDAPPPAHCTSETSESTCTAQENCFWTNISVKFCGQVQPWTQCLPCNSSDPISEDMRSGVNNLIGNTCTHAKAGDFDSPFSYTINSYSQNTQCSNITSAPREVTDRESVSDFVQVRYTGSYFFSDLPTGYCYANTTYCSTDSKQCGADCIAGQAVSDLPAHVETHLEQVLGFVTAGTANPGQCGWQNTTLTCAEAPTPQPTPHCTTKVSESTCTEEENCFWANFNVTVCGQTYQHMPACLPCNSSTQYTEDMRNGVKNLVGKICTHAKAGDFDDAFSYTINGYSQNDQCSNITSASINATTDRESVSDFVQMWYPEGEYFDADSELPTCVTAPTIAPTTAPTTAPTSSTSAPTTATTNDASSLLPSAAFLLLAASLSA